MTKADLISNVKASILTETGKELSKDLVKNVIDTTLTELTDCMTRGDEILLQPLGRFGVKFKNERGATNMKTGEKIRIPAKFAPNFRAATSLKDGVAELPVSQD